jgi:hypothetical protein
MHLDTLKWVERELGVLFYSGYSTTFQTPASNLVTPANGPLTSGGAPQFQIVNPTQVTNFVPGGP